MPNSVEENAFRATLELIKAAGVKINAKSLKNALLSNADFPSLAALNSVLSEFNVPNLATIISAEQLVQIPLPAVAHLNIEGGSFVIVTAISDESINWKHNTHGNTKESITDFSSKWDGIILLIEPNGASGEPNYEEIRKTVLIDNLRVPFIITGLIAILFYLVYPIFNSFEINDNWQFYGLLLTKFLGTGISIMLVWLSLDSNNSFLNKVCHLNKKTNCQHILSSEAASLGGIVSWSDVGLIYFFGGLLALLFFQKQVVPILQITSLLALPYTFWSVYHQAFKAKVWCPLCLSVQALLWVEFIVSLPISFQTLPINTFSTFAICFLIIAVLLALVKKPLKDSFQIDSLTVELQKLKFNPDFIQSLFSRETFLPSFDNSMKVIEMGNFEAETVFRLILNPTCGACRQKFLDIKKIIANHEALRYQIILSSAAAQDEISNQVTKNVLGLPNNTLMVAALYDWFIDENQNFDAWLLKWENQTEKAIGEPQRQLHRQWLIEAGITHVPVTYLNKVEIPVIYSANEAVKLLKYYSPVGFRNQQ